MDVKYRWYNDIYTKLISNGRILVSLAELGGRCSTSDAISQLYSRRFLWEIFNLEVHNFIDNKPQKSYFSVRIFILVNMMLDETRHETMNLVHRCFLKHHHHTLRHCTLYGTAWSRVGSAPGDTQHSDAHRNGHINNQHRWPVYHSNSGAVHGGGKL